MRIGSSIVAFQLNLRPTTMANRKKNPRRDPPPQVQHTPRSNGLPQPIQARNEIVTVDLVTSQDKKRKKPEPPTFNPVEPEPENNPGIPFSDVVEGNLDVRGVVRAQAFRQISDIRLKTNIEDLVDAVQIISRLQGKTYQWKDELIEQSTGGQRVIGLIAQEVLQVLPQVVHQDEMGLLSVAYAEIVPVLINAFNEYQEEYRHDREFIQGQIQELNQKMQLLEQDLDRQSYMLVQIPAGINYNGREIYRQYPNDKTNFFASHQTPINATLLVVGLLLSIFGVAILIVYNNWVTNLVTVFGALVLVLVGLFMISSALIKFFCLRFAGRGQEGVKLVRNSNGSASDSSGSSGDWSL